jgi:3-hydroxy-9,10-secoandrosta-1,3,5(10)-triene-9,17-dione monooxygenase
MSSKSVKLVDCRAEVSGPRVTVATAPSRVVASTDINLVAAATALIPTLRSRSAETDALARLPDATITDLEKAHLFDMLVPKMYGGLQCSPRTFMDVVVELGRGDGSAAWTVALLSTSTWMAAALYPKHVVDEVFSGGNFRTGGVLAPRTVKAKRVDGGVLIEEGSWSFNSGVYHAQWDILSIPIFDESGQFIDSGSALIPISQVTLLHDWDTIGLRGSGSTSVAVKDLFITYDRLSVFRRRDTGSHGVAGRHARHDGSIGNPQVFDSIDFEVGVYDRHGNHGPSWRYTSDASR